MFEKLADSVLSLKDPEDFPVLYRSADGVSLAAQRRFLTATKVRLGGLLMAAVGGAVTWSLFGVNSGGLLALIAFASALAAELYVALVRPERAWYEGRAAAESAKTLTWRYCVRGENFQGDDDAATDRIFLKELNEILQDLTDVTLTVSPTDIGKQITNPMRQARALNFTDRRELYLRGRVLHQEKWYSDKARWNATWSHRWLLVGIVFEFIGVVAAAARAFGGLQIDLLGIFAAAAATAIAWLQTKQFQNLATAYGITAQELASVAAEVEAWNDEATWPQFMGQAEEAISREHTLWRASRGLRVGPPTRG